VVGRALVGRLFKPRAAAAGGPGGARAYLGRKLGERRKIMQRLAFIVVLFTSLGASLLAQAGSEERKEPQSVAKGTDSAGSARNWVRPISELNRDLPSWLRFDGQFRDRFERLGGIGFKTQDDNHDLTQLRLTMILKPARWLEFVGETQDSRVFFNRHVAGQPPYRNIFDIRQAYAQLGDSTDGWFDIVAGRQALAFGDERIIGPSNWLNMGRTFDVARLDLHHSGFRLSLFASSVIVARNGVVDHHIQGNNLHGAYGRLTNVIPRTTIEPYVLWRLAPAGLKLNENAGRGALDEVTVGARVAGRAPGGLEYDVEMARQTGSLGPDSIHSWGGHWNLAKPLRVRFDPRPFVEANYASGTRDPSGRRWSTFDQLYPSSHNKLGFADQVGWRNIEQVRAGASETVGRRWKFTETYENFWLASARDALYSSGGAPVAQSADGSGGRHVGQEFDAWAEWKWKETIELGFGYARFFTGAFLNHTTSGKDFNYPFIYVTYNFTPSVSPPK
jgi:hypothetical protein